MKNFDLEHLINQKLDTIAFHDCSPNGLQVEGCSSVQSILTGVTACQALLDVAVEKEVDAVIVHHGLFWHKESLVVRDMKRNRLKTLLSNDINLYSYHLPLDAHPVLGNNAKLANDLSIRVLGNLDPFVFYGDLEKPLTGIALRQHIKRCLGGSVFHSGDNGPPNIQRVAWCSGNGQGFINSAARFGVDAYISGEVSEQTIHSAREMGIHFFAAGHHSTERGGVKALGKWLSKKHGFSVVFVDIPNPA